LRRRFPLDPFQDLCRRFAGALVARLVERRERGNGNVAGAGGSFGRAFCFWAGPGVAKRVVRPRPKIKGRLAIALRATLVDGDSYLIADVVGGGKRRMASDIMFYCLGRFQKDEPES